MKSSAERMLTNLEVLPELGRQKCFELGNPFYYQDAADAGEVGNEEGNFWRKEMPTGELYLVTIQVSDVDGRTYDIKDTVIRKIR